MKLRTLEIENFGIFSGQSLEFDPGFALVFGPNEAGKSTLLQLIRELLFGFKVQRNPYAFDVHTGDMAATGMLEVSDGTQLTFRRRKGSKDTVVGRLHPSGRSVDARALAGLLGDASRELYEQVFGFSLRELAAGEASLKEANLTEALYGGGLGGLANFQKVQAALQSEADSLFTPRGRNKQRIHQLLAQMKDQARAIKEATLKPRDYEHLVLAAREADAAVETLRHRLDSLRRRQAHLDRLAKAITPWLRQQQAERELAGLKVPPEFPGDGGEQFQQLKRRRDDVTRALLEIENELADETDRITGLQLAPDLVAQEAPIRELEQQIKLVAGFREDLPRRRQESETIKSEVLAQLRSFSPDWDHRQLERLQTTLVQREAVERLYHEWESLERLRDSTIAKRGAVASSINALEGQLERLTIEAVPDHLPALIDEADRYERDLDRLSDLREQLQQADAQRQGLLARLHSPLDRPFDETADLRMPLPATIAEFRQRMLQAEQAVVEAERQAATTEREQLQKQEQLGQLDARTAVPDREQLVNARHDRDHGWQLLREQVVDRQPGDAAAVQRWLALRAAEAGGDPIAALAQAYERSVTAVDALADERQEKAEQAANRDQLKLELQRLAKRRDDEAQRIETCRRAQAEVVAEWNSLWADCPFTPLSPEAMLQWLDRFEELVAARSHGQQLAERIKSLEASIAQFESRLAQVIALPGRTPRECLAHARQLHEAANTARGSRHAYEGQLQNERESLRELDEQLASIGSQVGTWQARWESVLAEFHFPRAWDVQVASKILSGLAAARKDWGKAADLDLRVEAMATGLANFESAVRGLCRQLAPELVEFVPEHAMKELQRRLEAAKAAQRDHASLAASCAKLRKQQAKCQQQLAAAEMEIKQLVVQAGAAGEAELEQVAEAARQRAELAAEHREASSQIHLIRGTEEESAFVSELQQADADAIAAQQQQTAEELAKAESEYDVALQHAARLADRRATLDGTSRAAELALELESTRSQFAAAVDRWAPLVLAQALMKQAITKFERDHQPAMLAEVERLLEQMTLGRYTAIERKLDEQGTLLVVEESGQRKEPHQLSTGTREQLYLAIRLAYVHHYCQGAEPLPIVMDDVLVNFDGERARQTLRVLAEVAEKVQIIFLTCHQHMMELAAAVLPESKPIVLPGGGLAEGRVVAKRTAQHADAVAKS